MELHQYWWMRRYTSVKSHRKWCNANAFNILVSYDDGNFRLILHPTTGVMRGGKARLRMTFKEKYSIKIWAVGLIASKPF